MSTEIERAMNTLKEAIQNDPAYAYSWHANIACMCADAIHADETEYATHDDAHRMGNEAATRFMKLCFDAETSLNMLEA